MQDDSTLENIKWLPKFLVVNKLEKTAYLYDNEEAASETSSCATNTHLIRIDNNILRDTFINQWRNKSDKFESYYLSSNKFANVNNANSIIQQLKYQHHLSNKDIGTKL